MESEILLSGIIGSSPIGIMSALGVLRMVSEVRPVIRPKMCWRKLDDWVAVLTADDEISEDDIISAVFSYLSKEKKGFFDDDDVRMTPDLFRTKAANILDSSKYSDRKKADFWTAFGSEMVVDRSQGLIKPTDFYMASGQQKFLSKVRSAMAEIDLSGIEEALFGPWKYNGDHSLAMGWDPNTQRIHAFRSTEPSKDSSPLCEVAAELLAFESLPLFPVFSDGKKRITAGFIGDYFLWPIWTVPANINAVRSLILAKEIFNESMRGGLNYRGVAAVYGSRRMEFSKGYGVLLPGELIWLSSS